MWIATKSVTLLLIFCTNVSCNDNPPNIVFIMMDDVGWNDVGYHNSSISTPHMDTIANDGVKLESYYVGHVCTPTRGMFLTGKHMINLRLYNGIIGGHDPKCLPVNEVTVAQKLREYNYATHAIGKWHLGYYKEECLPINRGFDTFFGKYYRSIERIPQSMY
ncbi:arylsulfatase I-like [Saccoglossus kowalevskii]